MLVAGVRGHLHIGQNVKLKQCALFKVGGEAVLLSRKLSDFLILSLTALFYIDNL